MSALVCNDIKIQVVSEYQSCSLGSLPPRMPDRADPQVPCDTSLGDVRYGRIGHIYFYDENSDASAGMVEIEVSVQRLANGLCRVEAFAVGDGFQSCSSNGRDAPLTLQLCRKDGAIVVESSWVYSKILCGHADALTYREEILLSKEEFESIELAVFPPTKGALSLCPTSARISDVPSD